MRKIPTLFRRDWTDPRHSVYDEVEPGCEWVLAGEGVATRKYDGTCVMFDGHHWWARREVKPGKKPPAEFMLAGEDPVTGKVMGWEPVQQSSFAKFHAEALEHNPGGQWQAGTYELIGPKVNGNPESSLAHFLVRHEAAPQLPEVPRDFEGLKEWMEQCPFEGVVWHHPDGRMVKLKRKDFRHE